MSVAIYRPENSTRLPAVLEAVVLDIENRINA
jgi:hypothetical protein